MAKVIKIKYFTEERLKLINPKNLEIYEKYRTSQILKNKEVKETTYKIYENYMHQFLVYLAEEWNNIELYSEDFFKNAIDIIEGFMGFCQDILMNNKKVINTKISAVSSLYVWAVKRKLVQFHPFDGKVERMKGANDQRITKDYFLDENQIQKITEELETNPKYDIQDRILFHLSIDSANRVAAIASLTLSSLNLDEMMFENIREKRGKRCEVIFNEVCKQYIEEWLEQRKELDNLEVDAILLTRYQGQYRPMPYSTIQERAKRIGRIIGLEDFHMHCFRKTSINRAMNLSGDIEIAKELANHKDVTTTMIYIKPKSKTEIRDKLRQLRQAKLNQTT